jgi:hypothetical protein
MTAHLLLAVAALNLLAAIAAMLRGRDDWFVALAAAALTCTAGAAWAA